jgi:hypothetical protein
MSRMVGATFGVAAIGAIFQHLATSQLTHELAGTGITAAQRDRIIDNLGSASDAAGLPPQAAEAAHHAFIHALSNGMWLSAGVAALGALLSLWLIAPKRAAEPDAAARPEAAAEVASPG